MSDTQLIHVRIPSQIVKWLDEIDQHRSRADKVSEALADYVRKRRLLDTIRSGVSSLSAEERQRWDSDMAVDTWVRERRAEYERDSSS